MSPEASFTKMVNRAITLTSVLIDVFLYVNYHVISYLVTILSIAVLIDVLPFVRLTMMVYSALILRPALINVCLKVFFVAIIHSAHF